MSELSEQIDAALRSTVEMKQHETEADIVVNVSDPASEITSTPYLDPMREYYVRRSAVLINRVYRQHVGAAHFKTATEAYEKTMGGMRDQLVPMLIESFCDGIQMAQARSTSYRKYEMFKKLERVFGNDGWRSESAAIALPMTMDPDATKIFETYLTSTIGHIGNVSGFSLVTNDATQKIYDLWALSASSCTMGCYAAGMKLGKQWDENDTLAGIMKASENADG